MDIKGNQCRFPYVTSIDELNQTLEAEEGYFVSPGGAATSLGVTREYIRLLEKRGHLEGYRMRQHRFWLDRLISTKPTPFSQDEVFVSVKSVRAYAKRVGRKLRGPVWPEEAP